MKMIIEVTYSDYLYQKDVLNEIRNGIQCIVGGGDPNSTYVKELAKTKIIKLKQYKMED